MYKFENKKVPMARLLIIMLFSLICMIESQETFRVEYLLGHECIVEMTRKPGTCTYVADCVSLGNSTQETVCGYNESKKIICCSIPISEGRTCEEKCISERKCEEYSTIVNDCNTGMIVGGVLVEKNEFPHMALLGYNDETGIKYWTCGGSLISEQYILTAAHCVQPMAIRINGTRKRTRINLARLGEHDYNKTNSETQDYGFTIIPHPEFNSNTKANDIALLKLKEKVVLSEFIPPACLPTTFDPHRPDAIVTGWGTTEFSGSTSSKLLKAGLEFSSYNVCFQRYKSESVTIVNTTQICAVDKVNDACQGDSGCPLQTRHPSYSCMYTVYGVMSFVIRCGKNVPGVYARVFAYLDWIESEVWKRE